jgi:hypothetical protein
MPLQATSGAASYDAFGGGAAASPNYIEDVFSTWLYTGTGAAQTITNGIDLAGKGGLVWEKGRSGADNHNWQDTARGTERSLYSNQASAQTTDIGTVTSFNSNGFSLGSNPAMNDNGRTYASWTFRKQPKFFDIVTWTGSGANRTIAHALNAEVGFIVVKRTDASSTWVDYHRGFPSANVYSQFGTTGASYYSDSTVWNNTAPTSSVFSLGSSSLVNASGGTYVAYLFAHNAGGFGLDGTQNVIVCGTADTAWSNITVDCGFEPQFVMARVYERTQDWQMFDNMRGVAVGGNDALLRVGSADAEDSSGDYIDFTPTGFVAKNTLVFAGKLFYIAIRRGPMKVPTTGTSVFAPVVTSGGTGTVITTGFPVDSLLVGFTSSLDSENFGFFDRLRGITSTTGNSTRSITSSTAAEGATPVVRNTNNTGFQVGPYYAGSSHIAHSFRRAPGFFDVVCYTGTGTIRNQTHNLGAAPELIIVKRRDATGSFRTRHKDFFGSNDTVSLNTTTEKFPTGFFTDEGTTSTTFPISNDGDVNASGGTFVAYLFASCPGVSKVGSYTGNGSSQTINCGFTAGARFILIKRTNATGDWYVWDTARGIVAGNDPHISLNTTAFQVTSNDTIDTDSTGFVVNQVAATNVNVSGGAYIYLAIA